MQRYQAGNHAEALRDLHAAAAGGNLEAMRCLSGVYAERSSEASSGVLKARYAVWSSYWANTADPTTPG